MIFDKLKSGVRFTLIFLGSAGLSFPPISALAGDGERRLASPEAAAAALVAAATEKDSNAFHSIFGPEGRDLVSADLAQADNSFSNFVRRLTQKVYLMHQADSTVRVLTRLPANTNTSSTATCLLVSPSWPGRRNGAIPA